MKRWHWVAAVAGMIWGAFSFALLTVERLREPVFHYAGGRFADAIAVLSPAVWALFLSDPQGHPTRALLLSLVLGAAAAILLVYMAIALRRLVGRASPSRPR